MSIQFSSTYIKQIILLHRWMDDLRFYVLSNSISVTSGRWTGNIEKTVNQRTLFKIEKKQHLQLCTAHTALSDSVIRSAKIG